MNKIEALKAVVEGKKVRCKKWAESDLVHQMLDTISHNAKAFLHYSVDDEEFEVIPDYVDFPTAWKAYENGHAIQSEGWNGAIMKCPWIRKQYEISAHYTLTPDIIRGRWIILG